LGILRLEKYRGEGVEEKEQKNKQKKRAFKLRRGGSAAMARRPPHRRHLTSTGEVERKQREGESFCLLCERRERKCLGNEGRIGFTTHIYSPIGSVLLGPTQG